MIAPLELTGLTKIFETPAGPFVAVKDVNVQVQAGEFVAILGHSGCGKSTVLSIISGLEQASLGGVVINGTETRAPGPELAAVFQTPCLLPWMTARQNVMLAARQVPQGRRAERLDARVDRLLEIVGVDDVAHTLPSAMSLGTQQCVSLARALALEPSILLLDEPFSQLDSLTRFELQDLLIGVWEQTRQIVVMVTHDVDEALYVADRLVLMTDGPEATVGEIMAVPFGRPRVRTEVLQHPEYIATRARVIDFLEHHAHRSRPSVIDKVIEQRLAEQELAARG